MLPRLLVQAAASAPQPRGGRSAGARQCTHDARQTKAFGLSQLIIAQVARLMALICISACKAQAYVYMQVKDQGILFSHKNLEKERTWAHAGCVKFKARNGILILHLHVTLCRSGASSSLSFGCCRPE